MSECMHSLDASCRNCGRSASNILGNKDAAIASLRAEVERLKLKVIHCEMCGSSWYDDGFTSSCPQCTNRKLSESLDWERSAKMNAYEHIEDTKSLRTRAEQAEAKVEKVREWALDFLPEDSGKYCELEQILK